MVEHQHGPGCGCFITRFTDREKGQAGRRSPLVRTRVLEDRYGRQLRRLAGEIGRIIDGYPAGQIDAIPQMQASLKRYSEIVQPWAENLAKGIVLEIEARDRKAWVKISKQMSDSLAREIRDAPTGHALRSFLAEHVDLITSLPIEAGERVHELTLKGLVDSTRASEIAREIGRSGEVAAGRATLIARTEVARTASGLTMARAVSVGSEGYIWRTAHDSDVRSAHAEMEGVFVRWDTPPKLSDGTVTHAGQIYNCRCYPEPVLPQW
jgi:SPP1 gp7 family putative phage head morphogenesis protein